MTATSEVAGQAGAAVIGGGYAPADFEVPPATATLIAEAVPENTALAYRSRWRSFEAWCTRAGRVALPATAQTVAAYLTHLATERGLRATTVDAHLTAIRAVHRGAGATAPDTLTARKVVVAAQRREAARDGRYGPRKAVPVMATDLSAIVAACDDQTAAGLRDRAVVLLGFALLARRSELAALNLSDVELVPGEGVAVTIRASKTDQSARGLVRRIHYASNERICPVRALLAWTTFLAARGVTTGPLFTRIDRWGNVGPAAGGRYAGRLGSDGAAGPPVSAGISRDGRLRPQAVGAIVTALCESAGLAGRPAAIRSRTGTAGAMDTAGATDASGVNRAADPAISAAETRRYSGHSLRRGGATSMLAAGAQPLQVSRHGRWSDGSRSFAGYVEEATGFGDANPTKGLLLCTPCTEVSSEPGVVVTQLEEAGQFDDRLFRGAWTSPVLDGQLYGEPLVADGRIVAATENDTVYVMAARSGNILWSRHLADPVPSGDLPCGDISPVVGITGTPVIDLARREIFVDADTLIEGPSSSGGVEASHRLFGLDLFTGKVELSQSAMPSAGEDQLAQLQRPGLALDHGRVVIAYGQNAGDCPGPNGPAHGYVVSIPEAGGPLDYFQVSSGRDRGAVWMGGSSPVVDPQGDVYLASADGYDLGAGQPYDDSDAVLELSPAMRLESIFYLGDWQQLSGDDLDLGTGDPALVGGFVFQVGKTDTAYLLRQGHLGGEDGEVASLPVCHGDPDGGHAVMGSVVFVPCPNGVTAIRVSSTAPYLKQLWTDNDGAAGGPIIADGLVWTIAGNAVDGLDPASGEQVVSIPFGGSANHFPTPSTADGLLLVPGTSQVFAFMGPAGLPPAPLAG